MNTLKNLQGEAGRELASSDTNTHKGIPMFCDEGLHESCFSYIKNLPKDSKILVLGSGGGSFDQRLIDTQFHNVTSIDFRPDFFRALGTTFLERDLNNDFNDLGTFDAIIAIELIEHLENPAHFLRETSKCLKQNGIIIVTTPNIESGPSRAAFFIMGNISFFSKADMQGSGHISPLLHHIFALHVENAGLKIANHTYNRNAWVARFKSNIREFIINLKKISLKNILRAFVVLAKSILLIILWPFTCFNSLNGNIHIYVLRKD